MERSLKHIAQIMTARGYRMSWQRAWQLEQRALLKIAKHPAMKEIAELFGFDEPPTPIPSQRRRRTHHG